MDMNLYFAEWLVRERLAEARAAARETPCFTRPGRGRDRYVLSWGSRS